MTEYSSTLSSTEQRNVVACRRFYAFPCQSTSLVRLVQVVYKSVHDDAITLIQLFDINHPKYILLMMLYDRENFMVNPLQLTETTTNKSVDMIGLFNKLWNKQLVKHTEILSRQVL